VDLARDSAKVEAWVRFPARALTYFSMRDNILLQPAYYWAHIKFDTVHRHTLTRTTARVCVSRLLIPQQRQLPTPSVPLPTASQPARNLSVCLPLAERCRPFRVLGPVVATSEDEGIDSRLSVRHSRATHTGAANAVTPPHFRPKLSPLSQSRAARVIEELRALNRSQPFRNLPLCGWYFVMATARRVRPAVTYPINVFADGQLAR
jgi:hypothetical protein